MGWRVWCVGLGLSACAQTAQRTEIGETEVITVRRAFANVHFVRQGDAAILVDAGFDEEADGTLEMLEREGADLGAVGAVVITHGHHDHAGGGAAIRDALGVPLIGGAGDVGMFRTGALEGTLCPTDGIAERRLEASTEGTFTPFEPDVLVDGELDLAAYGMNGRVVSLPGHTEGSLVVVAGEAVLVGDLLRGSVTGRKAHTHFYMCDLEDNAGDVSALLDDIAPAATTVFPGHFGPLRREAVEGWLEGL